MPPLRPLLDKVFGGLRQSLGRDHKDASSGQAGSDRMDVRSRSRGSACRNGAQGRFLAAFVLNRSSVAAAPRG
jgi:hypothetical protein